MSIKIYYLQFYLELLLENLEDVAEEQDESIQQDIMTMEEKYQVHMMANNCSSQRRDQLDLVESHIKSHLKA